jgi:hypothetical protein
MARSKYLKNTRLQNTLDSYAQDLKDLAATKPQQFDILTVSTTITKLPPRKWNAAQAVVNATVEKKECESKLKRVRAVKMLEASKTDKKTRLSNADDRKAFVDNDPAVQAAEVDLINAEAELTAARMAWECLDDMFTGYKKIMDFLVDQERATKQYNRFVDEGRQRS